jgi:hypothetical protein
MDLCSCRGRLKTAQRLRERDQFTYMMEGGQVEESI